MNSLDQIDSYILLANEWGASLDMDDPSISNRLYDEVQATFLRIKASQQEQELFERVDSVGDAAAFAIASQFKESNEPRAVTVYRRLAGSSCPQIATSAKYILKEMTRDRTG